MQVRSPASASVIRLQNFAAFIISTRADFSELLKMPGKCKLCLQMRDLRDSHLMAAALYKESRTPGNRNPSPLRVTERASIQTSHQLSNFAFCDDCEQLLSKNGEQYVMSQVYDGKTGRFPLLDTLRASTPSWKQPGLRRYDAGAAPSIDSDKLGYFAASVFWRASVHIWQEPQKHRSRLTLAPTTNPSGNIFWGRQDFRRVWRCSSLPAPTVSPRELLSAKPRAPGGRQNLYV